MAKQDVSGSTKRTAAGRSISLGVGNTDSSPPIITSRATVPAPLTSFIGRQQELVEIERLLSSHRLVTLLGPAGSGKTRLAIEAVTRQRTAHAFVELAPVTEPSLVAGHLALSLGVREVPGRPLLDALVGWFAGRTVLLVLDNCEHVLGACTELVRTSLERCSGVTVLATSREPLGVPGEVELRISPLSLPSPWRTGPRAVQASDAGRLFCERAALAQPGYRLTPAAAPAVASLCRRLDGSPLAIELAAPWITLLSEPDLVARLDDRFQLLRAGRSGVARHRTLEAAVDWSYALLAEAERAVFTRASVFGSGFTLEAAEAVCAAWDLQAGDLLNILRRLVDKSLLVGGRSGFGGSRFSMLETMRDFARKRLEESEEAEMVHALHARYFVAAARSADAELNGPRQLDTLDQLEEEQGNFRGALDWALAADPGTALALANALIRYWELRGPLNEAQHWLSAALARAPAATPARALGLLGSSRISWKRGDFDAARTSAEEALDLARAIGGQELLLSAIRQLSIVLHSTGDLDRSLLLAEEALVLAREVGDAAELSDALWAVGITRYFAGDAVGAGRVFEELLAVAEQLREPMALARARRMLALIELDAGRLDRARDLFADSLRTRWSLRDLPSVAYALEDQALLALAEGRYERGFRLAGAAAELREALGARAVQPWRDKVASAMAAARRAVGTRWRAWQQEGRSMAVEHSVAYALGTQIYVPAADRRDAGASLSQREAEVVQLLVQGLTNRQIAERLGIGERTVDSHVDHVRDKLGLRTRVQIAAWATTEGAAKQT